MSNICKECEAKVGLNRVYCNNCIPKKDKLKRMGIKKENRKIKLTVFEHYGGECKCCKENIIDLLTIDHVNNDGFNHRKETHPTGAKSSNHLYRWLIKNNFPKDDFQVLCFNCNIGKRIGGGICPHRHNSNHTETYLKST